MTIASTKLNQLESTQIQQLDTPAEAIEIGRTAQQLIYPEKKRPVSPNRAKRFFSP